LTRKSNAPAFIASTVVRTSPTAETKITVMSGRSAARRRCSSTQPISEIAASSTRQLGAATAGQARKPATDSKIRTSQPAERPMRSARLRGEPSSSITNTIGVTLDAAPGPAAASARNSGLAASATTGKQAFRSTDEADVIVIRVSAMKDCTWASLSRRRTPPTSLEWHPLAHSIDSPACLDLVSASHSKE
jgi:hypothetical protein